MNVNTIAATAWGFAKRYRITLLIWVIILIFGALSYRVFLNREGFPAINLPLASVQGVYLVGDEQKVDQEVVIPITKALETVDSIDSFQASARPNGFGLFIFFDESVSAEDGANEVDAAIKELVELPETVSVNVAPIEPALFYGEYNLVAAVYDQTDSDYESLQNKAEIVAEQILVSGDVESAKAIEVIEESVNPQTGQAVERQTSINKVGIREGDSIVFYPAASVGVVAAEGVDDLALSDAVTEQLENADIGSAQTTITADFATTIRQQVSSLQSNLLSGLIAVVIVALLLISWRASIVIALFIPTVLAATFLGMFALGYTLNTITLFAVILTLGLFVDDATIIVEALDAGRKKRESHKEIIKKAVGRVGVASLAGTLTTILVFTPMLFVSGILGSFIKLLPITVILALVLSFVISIVLVPLLSRIMVLSNWSDIKILKRLSILLPVERRLGDFVAKLPLKPKKSSKRRTWFHVGLFSFSIMLILASGVFAGMLKFDIFPQPKDGDRLQSSVIFQRGSTIDDAEAISSEIDTIIADTIGNDLAYVTYLEADELSATIEIGLIPFTERDTTSVEYVELLEKNTEDFQPARVQVSQISAGPPVADYPFQMRVYGKDQSNVLAASNAVVEYLNGRELELGGNQTKISDAKIEQTGGISRSERGQFQTVLAQVENTEFNSAAVIEIERLVKEQFDDEALLAYGITTDQLDFDVSQESENADSFGAIGIGLVVAIFLMYIILVLLFDSWLQPLLILMAVPFSLFGVFFGLYVTDNPMSFFVMLAILGLVGIVVNNSILLTEYANQEKAAGADNRTAISQAVKDRFRPLIVTTTTTVFALLPLALSDPFWQALAYTLIFGIISSTLLIIISFPYYYLMVEWIRDKKNNRFTSLR